MDSITPNDVTGIAALDPRYALKAKEIEGMPLDQQVDALLSSGLDARTASLILKAKLLREAAGKSGQPVSQQTVAEEVDDAIARAAAHRARRPENGGIPSIPMPDNMFQNLAEPSMGGGTGQYSPQAETPKQSFAKGGIVAFAGKDSSLVENPNAPPLTFTDLLNADLAGMNSMGLMQAVAPPKAPEAPTADPRQVADIYNRVRRAPNPYDPRNFIGANVGYSDTRADMAPVMADRLQALETLKKLGVPDRDTIFSTVKAEAEKLGLNKAETKGLADLVQQRIDLDAWQKQQRGYALLKAGQDVLKFGSDYRLGGAGHQALAAAIVGMGGYGGAMREAQKDYMAARKDLANANYNLEAAIDKNNMGLITLTDKRYSDLLTAQDNAQRRVDELDRSIASEAAATRRANASAALGRAQISAMNNPGLQYVGAFEELDRQRMQAEQIPDPTARAQALANIDAVEQTLMEQRDRAIGSTTSAFNTLTRTQAQQAIARLNAYTRVATQQMDAKGVSKMEQDLAMIPDDPNNPVLHSLYMQKVQLLLEAKQRLGLLAGGVQAQADALGGSGVPLSTPGGDVYSGPAPAAPAAPPAGATVSNW